MHDRSFEIGSYVYSGNSDCLDTLILCPLVALQVRFCRAFEVMGQTVDFNRYRC
jgi:hypothetical protein